MKRWVIGLVVLIMAIVAVPVFASEEINLVDLLKRVVKLEERITALEAEGFARINKAGTLGSSKTKDGIGLKVLGVTAGQHGTLVAVRITNDSKAEIGFSKHRFTLVAGSKQLTDPLYRFDWTDDVIYPGAYQDFIMVFDPLPASTKSVQFIPSLRDPSTYSAIKASVEAKL